MNTNGESDPSAVGTLRAAAATALKFAFSSDAFGDLAPQRQSLDDIPAKAMQLAAVAAPDREPAMTSVLALGKPAAVEGPEPEPDHLALEQQFRRIAEVTPAMLTRCSCDLRYLFVNRAYADMLGLKVAQIIGRRVPEILGAETWAAIRPMVERALKGDPVEFEWEFVHPRRARRFLHAILQPEQDRLGCVQGWIASLSDFTERKRAEEAIELVSRIPRENPAPVIRLHEGRTLSYLNPAAQRLLASDALDQHSDAVKAMIQMAGDALASGVICDRELSLGRRHYSVTFAPVVECGYVNLYFVDITERIHAQKAMQESEARFRSMAESAPVMIWMSGINKACTYFNRAWLEFTGRSLEQEAGHGWKERVHPDDLKHCLEVYETAFEARRVFQVEYRLRRWDGQYRWICDRGSPRFCCQTLAPQMPDSSARAANNVDARTRESEPCGEGEFCGYIGSCVDITERKESECILLEANAELEARVQRRTAALTRNNEALAHEIEEHKKDKQALQRVAAIVESSADAILSVTLDQVVVSWNRGAELLSGFTMSEMLGASLASLATLEPPDLFQQMHAQCVQDERVGSVDTILLTKTGARVEVALSASAVKDVSGTVTGVSFIARNITRRKQAEEKLRRALALMNDLYHRAPCAYHSLDRDARFVEINDTALQWLGFDRDELIGKKTIFDLQTRASRQAGLAAFRRLRQGQPIHDLELEFLRKDGSLLPVLLNASAITGPAGEFMQSRSTFFDLTARREVERALAESEARLQAVLDYSPAVIFLKDPKGRYLLVNRQFERAFGVCHEGIVGRTDAEIFGPARARELRAHDRRVLRVGAPRTFEQTSVRPNGSRTNMVVKFPLLGKDGKAYALGSIVVDITPRKRAEEALLRGQRHFLELYRQARKAQAGLRELSQAMVHALEQDRQRISRELHDEVGQSLTAISMSLAALGRDGADPGSNVKAFGSLQKLLEESMRTVHEVALDLRPSALDELGLVPALRSHLKRFAAHTRLQVRLRSNRGVDRLSNEKKMVIFRIAQESLNNVARHAHASRVTVTLRRVGPAVVLTVADNGLSFRAPPARASGQRRLGLIGMRERARLVNGKFRVLRRLGKGTTIRVEVVAVSGNSGTLARPRTARTIAAKPARVRP